jgi:hypothetical protein
LRLRFSPPIQVYLAIGRVRVTGHLVLEVAGDQDRASSDKLKETLLVACVGDARE